MQTSQHKKLLRHDSKSTHWKSRKQKENRTFEEGRWEIWILHKCLFHISWGKKRAHFPKRKAKWTIFFPHRWKVEKGEHISIQEEPWIPRAGNRAIAWAFTFKDLPKRPLLGSKMILINPCTHNNSLYYKEFREVLGREEPTFEDRSWFPWRHQASSMEHFGACLNITYPKHWVFMPPSILT